MIRYFILIILFTAVGCADFSAVMGGGAKTSATVMRVDGRTYIVREGDTLTSIAKKHRLTAHELAQSNSMADDDGVTVGQELLIPTVKERAKVSKANRKKESASKSKTSKNSKQKSSTSQTNQQEPSLAAETPEEADPVNSKFIWPVDGIVTSLMGPRRGRPHDGIDISAPLGTPVVAIRQGTVIFAGKMSGYGNLVIIKHPSNYFSAYAHLSEIKAAKDEKVKQGTLIGKVGRTGRASATHLHFETRNKTTVIDPMKLLPKRDPSTIRKDENSED